MMKVRIVMKANKEIESGGNRLTSTACFLQVRLHAVVIREHGCGGSYLSAHVTDRGHAWMIKSSGIRNIPPSCGRTVS